MPFYYKIAPTDEGRRTAQRLLSLQEALRTGLPAAEEGESSAAVPRRSHTDTLLLCTWNLREFDSASYGERSKEALYYIAEVISHFDLVAIQEVREDLTALDELRNLLGRANWCYMVTDVTEGRAGNRERTAFLYDERKVRTTGLAGEIVLPPTDGGPPRQLARSPFVVGFQAGWFKFALCTAHIYYGSSTASDPRRVEEIRQLADFLSRRVERYRRRYGKQGKSHSEYENVILLGDFNIFRVEDATFQALTDNGFFIHPCLLGATTNYGREKRAFDQIAFLEDEKNVKATDNAGAFDFFRVVYRDDDRDLYADEMTRTIAESSSPGTPYGDREERGKTRYYRRWRTYQMSDHRPLWIELKIDFSREYLERKRMA